jgi:hypothetical protein
MSGIINGNIQDWVSYLNNHYIEANAPEVYVFKLDKKETAVDELYGGETFRGSRIYTPPFKIRAFYLDNKWTQQLGSDTFPYLELQEDITFAVNFDNMILKIRDLKAKKTTELKLEYKGRGEAYLSKKDNMMKLEFDEQIVELDLSSSYLRTTKKLADFLNSLNLFICEFCGDNDISVNLVDFKKTKFSNKKISFFSEDDTYKNMTDIIESGDLILTEKYFLYEVHSNLPGGNIGWDYSMMLLTANTRSLDKAELPNNWNDLIRQREYGLRDKLKIE